MSGILDNSHIKSLKPVKNGKYHQGYVSPQLMKKCYDSVKNEPIIYRSGLELQFIHFCENNPKIAKWASEPIAIPYYSRILKKKQNYYPDYIIENDKGERTIVEIKPYSQTIKPTENSSLWLKQSWIINVDKWTAAKKFADDHNMKFIIVTEKYFD